MTDQIKKLFMSLLLAICLTIIFAAGLAVVLWSIAMHLVMMVAPAIALAVLWFYVYNKFFKTKEE